jgi:hypothetical protein
LPFVYRQSVYIVDVGSACDGIVVLHIVLHYSSLIAQPKAMTKQIIIITPTIFAMQKLPSLSVQQKHITMSHTYNTNAALSIKSFTLSIRFLFFWKSRNTILTDDISFLNEINEV